PPIPDPPQPKEAPVLETAQREAPAPQALDEPVVDTYILSKISSPARAVLGRRLTYVISFGNDANISGDTAKDVHLIDTLPPEVRLIVEDNRPQVYYVGENTRFLPCTVTAQAADGTGGIIDCALGDLPAEFTIRQIQIEVSVEKLPAAGEPLAYFNCRQLSTTAQRDHYLVNMVKITTTSKQFEDGDPFLETNNYCGLLTTVNGSDLAVTKTANPDPAKVGEALTYTVTVKNNGPDPAKKVVLTDILPDSVELILDAGKQPKLAPDDGNCTGPNDPAAAAAGVPNKTVTCELGKIIDGVRTLAARAEITLTLYVRPSKAGEITNKANAFADALFSPDGKIDNNSVELVTEVLGEADLAVLKEDDLNDPPPLPDNDTRPDKLILGQAVHYIITVTNNGPDPAKDIVLTDPLPNNVVPPGANSVAATPQGECDKSIDPLTNTVTNITCKKDELQNGQSWTIRVSFTPTAAGLMTNTATVTAATDDNDGNNDEDKEITDVVDNGGGGGGPGPNPPPPGPNPPPPGPNPPPPGPPNGGGPIVPGVGPQGCLPGQVPVDTNGDGVADRCSGETECPAGEVPFDGGIDDGIPELCSACPEGQEPFDTDGDGVAEVCQAPGECPSGTQPCHPVNGLHCPDDAESTSDGETQCYPIPWIPENAAFNPPKGQRIKWHDVFITSRAECLSSFQGEHHFNDEGAVSDQSSENDTLERF
ncbi:MAG: hypothetical protein COT71_00900, partial [Candidatus Andersenbacteria bacterium CG10_big_fil_rev_8_21_14_0_10_54_11]